MSINVESSEVKLANIIRLSGILEIKDFQKLSDKLEVASRQKVNTIILDISLLKYIGPGGSQVLKKCFDKAKKLKIELFINSS